MDWKKSVDKWAENYRAIPKTATGVTPNEVMFDKDPYSKLPSRAIQLTKEEISTKLEANDARSKQKSKFYNDLAHKIKHVTFKMDEPVLVKWSRENKQQALFDPDAYRITGIKGKMIEASRTDHYICRNCKYFKSITENCYQASMARLTKRPKSQPPIFGSSIRKLTKQRRAVSPQREPINLRNTRERQKPQFYGINN